jgi:hypothetical protein
MFDFNIIINIIISAALLYVLVNGVFRYHVFSDLFLTSMVLFILVVLFIYSNKAPNLLFYILLGLVIALFGGLYLFFYFKKTRYIFFFNTNKQFYHRFRYYLQLNQDENINYTYDKKTFMVISFKDSDKEKLKTLLKNFEKTENKRRSFTMCNYWQIIIYITFMIVLWRF